MVAAVNATGWAELMDGSLVSAAFLLFNTALAGWLITFLFITYQAMLYMKMRSPSTNFITGMLYFGIYSRTAYFNWNAGGVMLLLLTAMFTMTIYDLIVRNRTAN